MSRAKDHEKTYLWRHRQDIIETVLEIMPGQQHEFYFKDARGAHRFRERLYSFVKPYYGYQKFVIELRKNKIIVKNLAGEIYERKKKEDEDDSFVRGVERKNCNEGGGRE